MATRLCELKDVSATLTCSEDMDYFDQFRAGCQELGGIVDMLDYFHRTYDIESLRLLKE